MTATLAGPIVARVRANGAPDPDFGGDGRVMLGVGRASGGLAQPQNRRLVVAGNVGRHRHDDRHAPEVNGVPDTTFGGGTATIDFGPLADLADGAALPE